MAKIAGSDQVTQHGRLKGKPGYFAPEQIAGTPIDARVDLFALGVLLHETLCLRHLFHREGEGMASTIYRIMQMEIPEPASIRTDAPRALDRIIMKALSREPDDRWASAADMGRELDAVVRRAGRPRRGPGPLRGPAKRGRPRRARPAGTDDARALRSAGNYRQDAKDAKPRQGARVACSVCLLPQRGAAITR